MIPSSRLKSAQVWEGIVSRSYSPEEASSNTITILHHSTNPGASLPQTLPLSTTPHTHSRISGIHEITDGCR